VVVEDGLEDGVEDGVTRDAPVRIAERAWAAGLGWYTQRTVVVDDDQLDGLIAELQRARAARRARTRTAWAEGAEGASAGAKVLPFRARRTPSE
jgi:hypothetical protein